MNQTTERILALLRETPGFVSGERVCVRLGISRSAVWKHVARLREAGYTVESVRNRGHRLIDAPNTPYPAEVRPWLRTRTLGKDLQLLESTESTNIVAARQAEAGAVEGLVVVADTQTHGRGRMERRWHSPPGLNLYFSVLLRPKSPPFRVPELALVTAIAARRGVLAVAPGLDPALRVKWPNYLYLGERKVAGTLCDMAAETGLVHHLVVGVGMNVNLRTADFPPDIAATASSLAIEAGASLPRARLLAELLNHLEQAYEAWQTEGLSPFIAEWRSHSLLLGRTVELHTTEATHRGRVTGLSPEGALLLQTESGEARRFYSGDAHIGVPAG